MIEHGIDCVKAPHYATASGYQHEEYDDMPYFVDGVRYCGRCHMWMNSPEKDYLTGKGPKRMTRKELVKEIAQQTTYNQGQVMAIISHMENRIEAALMRGETVELSGFGKWEITWAKARMGRNPSTGLPIEISAGRKVKFRPGKNLKRAVAG